MKNGNVECNNLQTEENIANEELKVAKDDLQLVEKEFGDKLIELQQ